MSRRQGDRDTTPMVVTTLRIPREKMTRFRDIAALQHRTAAQEMRALIDARIAEHEREAA